MQTYNQIQALLDRYWEGETSIEEERQLRQYFHTAGIDERLIQFAPLFRAIQEEQTVQLKRDPKTVELRPVMHNWTRWAAAASIIIVVAAGAWWFSGKSGKLEAPVANAPVENLKNESKAPETTVAYSTPENVVDETVAAKKPAKKRTFRAIFASRKKPAKLSPEEQKAMDEVKAALALVSNKLNKGKKAATKNIDQIEYIDKIFKHKGEG